MALEAIRGGATITPGSPPVRTDVPVAQAATPDRQLFNAMAAYLAGYGLTGLFTVSADGTPSGWLWQQMINGIDTQDEITIAVESTPEWQRRFSTIVDQRKLAATDARVQVMTPDQVRQYEITTAATMRQAGLPQWMYDNPQADFHDLMVGGVSPQEVQDRLGSAFQRVKDTPPAVRQAFEEFYGVGNGDAGLAAYFLNPDKAMATLERASKVAFTAGTANRYGMNIDQGLAGAITDKGLSDAGIEQGFENVNRLGTVFAENAGEGTDLTATKEGIGAVFNGDSFAQQAINRRIAERQNNSRSTTGGALVTQGGAVGAGRIDQR